MVDIQHQKHLKKLERLIQKIYHHHSDLAQNKLDYSSSKHHNLWTMNPSNLYFRLSSGVKKQNLSLIDSIKAANSKISILTEEVGSHNVEKMRQFYKKPELSGRIYNDTLLHSDSLKPS